MSIIKTIADQFRTSSDKKPLDRYGILSPLIATGDMVTETKALVGVLTTGNHQAKNLLQASYKAGNPYAEKAQDAYKKYLAALPNHEKMAERPNPLITLQQALEAIDANITSIEDNFKALFGGTSAAVTEQNLKASSVMVIGYVSRVENLCTWISAFCEHITADSKDMIAPFHTREMLNKAEESAIFVADNLEKWGPKQHGLLNDLKSIQSRGIDVYVQSKDGMWIDEFVSDDQLNPTEQALATAAFRGLMWMVLTHNQVRAKAKIDLFTARKEWLTSKVVLEQGKMRGMVEGSAEYERLRKAVVHYSNKISQYEQKLERVYA